MVNKLMRETGYGGSIVIYNNDIQIDKGMFTDIYLKLFATVTPFWANNIFDIDLNSLTLQALQSNSLDAKGIENIKRAVQSDLKKISYATFNVRVTAVNDYLEIKIDAKNNYTMQIIWDFTAQQDLNIEIQETTTGTPILTHDGFELLTHFGQTILAK